MKTRKTTLYTKESPQPGYVYLLNAIGTDNFKIGKTSTAVSRRIKELQTGSPLRIRYVYHACVEEMDKTEKELHLTFKNFRRIGEWFYLNCEQVKECILLMQLVQCDESTLASFTSLMTNETEEFDKLDIVSPKEEAILEALRGCKSDILKEFEFPRNWDADIFRTILPREDEKALFCKIVQYVDNSLNSAGNRTTSYSNVIKFGLGFNKPRSHGIRSYWNVGLPCFRYLLDQPNREVLKQRFSKAWDADSRKVKV